ncbi:MAG: hypothetical protein A2X22_05045 [Bacteroidetes bacterium GWF2_49_14]|nr:MAG: hypothetical protein A2X22_05045 [Bacteroidetes bacterium GWF2_49_14]HBB92142.1 hypothetical protein [Bacteroidales bacterium]
MKLTLALLVMILMFSLAGFSQDHQRFQASFSAAFRYHPMIMGDGTPSGRTTPLFFNLADQLNGPGFNVSLGYFFPQANLLLSLDNTVRHQIIGFQLVYAIPKPDSRRIAVPIWRVLSDPSVSITKYFDLGSVDPLITVGAVWMNRNSGYFVPDSSYYLNPSGGYNFSGKGGNFNFTALKTGAGVRYNHWIGEVNVLWGFQHVYDFIGTFMLPEIRLGYAITR